MKIIVFFTNNGIPQTGLTPVMDIWKIDGTHLISNANMTEIGGGFYYYEFAQYTDSEDYCFRADGGNTLPDRDRYYYGSNEMGEVTTYTKLVKVKTDTINWDDIDFIKQIEGGKWTIDTSTKQMIFYSPDNTTEIARFNLYDENGQPNYETIYTRERA